MIMIHKKKKN